MGFSYIRVDTEVDLFSPASRAFGNVAVIGQVDDTGHDASHVAAVGEPQAVGTPAQAKEIFPGTLGESISMAFRQTPGPSRVYGIRVASETPDWAKGLQAAETLDVQFVVLAKVALDSTTGGETGAIKLLADHVATTSNTGGDGAERMGVAMLKSGETDVAPAKKLAEERMVFVAHRSDEDAAAAVAGTISGYPPHISPLLKPVSIESESFTATEIQKINGDVEQNPNGPTGQGVLWLTHPALIPGGGIYMGEAYTGKPGDMKYIDVVRTVDDVKFRLKARLIATIGNLRITRSGLRSLVAQLEAELDPLVRREVIDDYQVVIPLIALLDRDPDSLTPSETQQIKDARHNRVVEVLVAITYAGAIHRIAMTLKFT